MHEFFKVWGIAKQLYGLERLVHIDLEEAYIRIFLDGKIIVRADGPSEDLEYIYLTAASYLVDWLQQQGKR